MNPVSKPTMNSPQESDISLSENEAQSGPCLTRRAFIKRTTATVLATVFALDALKNEALAQNAGSSEMRYLLEVTGWGKPMVKEGNAPETTRPETEPGNPNQAAWFEHPDLAPKYSDYLDVNGFPILDGSGNPVTYVLDENGEVLTGTGVRFRGHCQTQALDTYTQTQHPRDATKWGYWNSEWPFSWRYQVNFGTTGAGGIQVSGVYSGKVSIDEDTGKITETVPNIPPEAGYLNTDRTDCTVRYRVTVTGTGKSIKINLKMWSPRKKNNGVDTAPPANEAPAVDINFEDTFSTGTLSYPKP
jgi:hypothetical protein